jgi:nucleobase:cation symporter-1, NCS1 family
MNDYTGSLSLQAAGIRVPRVYSAIVVAVLGFVVTLWLNSSNLVGKIENILLFLSYWIAPWAAVVLADWWLRRGRATVSRLVDFGGLPSGLLALVAMAIGFAASLPFQTSTLGGEIATNTGLPINIWAPTLHYADIAYLVGFVVAFAIFWVGARTTASRTLERESSAV